MCELLHSGVKWLSISLMFNIWPKMVEKTSALGWEYNLGRITPWWDWTCPPVTLSELEPVRAWTAEVSDTESHFVWLLYMDVCYGMDIILLSKTDVGIARPNQIKLRTFCLTGCWKDLGVLGELCWKPMAIVLQRNSPYSESRDIKYWLKKQIEGFFFTLLSNIIWCNKSKMRIKKNIRLRRWQALKYIIIA